MARSHSPPVPGSAAPSDCRVGFNRSLGTILLIAGPTMIAIEVLILKMVLTGPILVGVAVTVAGLLMRFRTYLTMSDREIVVHALAGPFTKKYPADPRTLQLDETGLLVEGRRVALRKQADATDWAKLVEFIRLRA